MWTLVAEYFAQYDLIYIILKQPTYRSNISTWICTISGRIIQEIIYNGYFYKMRMGIWGERRNFTYNILYFSKKIIILKNQFILRRNKSQIRWTVLKLRYSEMSRCSFLLRAIRSQSQSSLNGRYKKWLKYFKGQGNRGKVGFRYTFGRRSPIRNMD